jgi:hypothetical protein
MATTVNGHRVVSRLVPQDSRVHVLVCSTRIDDKKTVITGVGISDGNQGTAIANRVIAVVAENCTGRLVICQCNDAATARRRACKALIELADDGDGLFIACRTSAIVDAVLLPKTFGLEA